MPDPAALARLHAASFTTPRPWSEAEIAVLLDDSHVFLCADTGGFLMGRVVLDEAELLTIAVDPALRREGIGTRLVAAFLAEARQRGAARAFLEVAASNDPAIALYQAAGFASVGRRKGYYLASDGEQIDAIVLSLSL